MGNQMIPVFDSSSSSSPSSTRPSSPAISRNNSNEGTHSGSRSAFSCSLNGVSPCCQILPITPTPRIFSFAELKKATRNFNLKTLMGGGDFGRTVFKGWISRNNSNEGTHSGSRSAFSSSLNEVSPHCQILPITPTSRIFSFAELKKATRNFSLNTLIGGGDFGPIFKGWIDEKTFAPRDAGSGMAIAVRKLNSESLQEWKEWQSDVNLMGIFSYENAGKLLGSCWEDEELLLVYKFTP